jgi:nucleoside 2-deoxyribosyltransferase
MKVYLSIPICHRDDANKIEEHLQMRGIEVLNPCRIVHDDCPKEHIPFSVAEECRDKIKESKAVILYTDNYGRDCSWEIGYAFAISKPIFPFYIYSEANFLQEDWMIKSSLMPTSEGLDSLVEKLEILQNLTY